MSHAERVVGAVPDVAAPAVAEEYQSKDLAAAASDWRRELIERIPANKHQPAMIADWRRMADTLCLDGMKHGGNYTTEILAGLPAATGERLRETFRTRVVVPDRKPQQRFSGTGYVPPKPGTAGLPLTTINVDKVKLRLLRVNERNLVPSVDAEWLTMSFSSYAVDEIINCTGSPT